MVAWEVTLAGARLAARALISSLQVAESPNQATPGQDPPERLSTSRTEPRSWAARDLLAATTARNPPNKHDAPPPQVSTPRAVPVSIWDARYEWHGPGVGAMRWGDRRRVSEGAYPADTAFGAMKGVSRR